MAVFFALLIISCKEDEQMNPLASFTVTIQNVFEGKDYFMSGKSEFIAPGESYSFSFHAGKGHNLSYATMFGQSNDLFYALDENGIALYDDSGNPLTGDITSMFDLWDAGTEVNQEPGVGLDQAPRQSGPDTGMDENSTVTLLTDVNDGFSYPEDNMVIKVTIEHDSHTMFTVTVTNVSDAGIFQTPLAPGTWVIHSEGQPIFTSGREASEGLEHMAEDGANSMLAEALSQNSGYVSPIAPGAWAVHNMSNPVYVFGQVASVELEALAEDGDPSGFLNSLQGVSGIRSYGIYNTPLGGGSPAPIFPNEQFTFEFEAESGDKLSFASMLGQSNDLFVGADIDLFQNGVPVSGDITSHLDLLDAMTEVNEFPGAGNFQAPRQPNPDSGEIENGPIGVINDSFEYPMITDMVKVSITSNIY